MKLFRLLSPILLLTFVVSVQAQQPQLVVVEGKKCIIHTVTGDDTYYSLAKQYDVPLKQIIEINGAEDATKLAAGSMIYIPYNEKSVRRSAKANDVDNVQQSIDGEFIVHTIADGDTLYSIAKHYKISLASLIADNPTADATALEIGSTLLVRTAKVGYATIKDIEKEIKRYEKDIEMHSKSSKPKLHVVTYGETLYSLSRRYKISEDEILALNGLKSASELLNGMTIIVRGGTVLENAAESNKADNSTLVENNDKETHDTLGSKSESEDSLAMDEKVAMMNATLDESNMRMIDSLELAQQIPIPKFDRFERGDTLNVVALLPVHQNGKTANAFVDLYRGMLLALQDLRRDGYAVNLSVFDTERSAIRLSEILESDVIQNANLILGPVYNNEMELVLPVAERLNIPVVNPMLDVDPAKISSPILFQMQADSKYKYEKYAHILDGSYEIYAIYAPTYNAKFETDILNAMSNLTVTKLNAKTYGKIGFVMRNSDGTDGAAVAIKTLVQGAGKKAIIVMSERDYDTSAILKAIGEYTYNMPQDGANDCFVIGDREWERLVYADREGFFTSGLSILAPYNAKRTDNNAIKVFESRFLQTYGILPTAYACRGYDAAMMFCTKMFTGLDKYILLERITPLATTYQFKFEDGMFINTEWVNIQHMRNFTISYK